MSRKLAILQPPTTLPALCAALTLASAMAGCADSTAPDSNEPPHAAAASLAIRTEPGDGASGQPLSVQPVVEVLDVAGALLTIDNQTVVTATVASGGGVLEGSVSVRTTDGVVTFTDLVARGTVGQWSLSFSANGLPATTSNGFALTPGVASPATSLVSVSSASVVVGGEVELSLQAVDREGNRHESGGLSVQFSTSGGTSQGTIGSVTDNGNGSYAAPFTATSSGSATTVASAIDGETVTSNLPTLTVTDATDPPLPGTTFFFEPFENSDFSDRGWYDISGATLTTTEHIDPSTSALEMTFNEGSKTVNGSVGRHLFDETETVYLSYWVKYTANWVGSQRSYHPHEFYVLTNKDGAYVGPASAVLEVRIEQNHDRVSEMLPLVILHDRRVWGSEGFTDEPGPRYKNDWHFIEVYLQMNSAVGVADGIVQHWFDGTLVSDVRDVEFRVEADHDDMLFNQLLVGPYIGDGSPATQTMWIDDLTVASSRP